MREMNQTETRNLEQTCQAISPMDEPCDTSASYHCGICGMWLCAVQHAEDEASHHCILEPGDEGGEA